MCAKTCDGVQSLRRLKSSFRKKKFTERVHSWRTMGVTHESPFEDVLRNVGGRRRVPLDGVGVGLFPCLGDDHLDRPGAAWGVQAAETSENQTLCLQRDKTVVNAGQVGENWQLSDGFYNRRSTFWGQNKPSDGAEAAQRLTVQKHTWVSDSSHLTGLCCLTVHSAHSVLCLDWSGDKHHRCNASEHRLIYDSVQRAKLGNFYPNRGRKWPEPVSHNRFVQQFIPFPIKVDRLKVPYTLRRSRLTIAKPKNKWIN